MSKLNKKFFYKIIEKLILLSIVLILIYIFIGICKENKIKFIEDENYTKKINIEKVYRRSKEKVNVEEEYLGFKVIAKLEIPEINLETNILEEYSSEGMKVCATKFWGASPNEIGNFCVTGHNYKKKNMFNHLIDLNIGNEIYLSDNKNGKYIYKIYDIYKVKSKNMSPLNISVNGKREITLITCVNYTDNRLIIKAIEE